LENKIWYSIFNTKDYDHIEGLLYIQPYTMCSLEHTIKSTIDSFNSNHVWEDMWTMEIAKKRLQDGHDLFLGVDLEGSLAHVWFDKNYLYNAYINPRRKSGYGVKFIQACLNFIEYDNIKLYCDDWNIGAQKLFEKVGFQKNNSYI
jgi:ribosomal protein S18 acetylase RimI-like enzyme